MHTAAEPLHVAFQAPSTVRQDLWLAKHGRHIRSVTFHPDDSLATSVVENATLLHEWRQSLRSAHNVEIGPGFKQCIAACSSLQTLSLTYKFLAGLTDILLDQLTRLPVSLRDLTITRVGDTFPSLPSKLLPLEHLTNLTSLTLCNIMCACSVCCVSMCIFFPAPWTRLMLPMFIMCDLSRWCCAMQA